MRLRDGILVVGDLHFGWPPFFKLIREHRPSLVLQVGDLDYLPASGAWAYLCKAYSLPKCCSLHFCEGNHDDLDSLWALREPGPPRAYQVHDRTFWQDRGSTLTLPDGRVVCFVGGAYSVDRPRKPGEDWWPEKEILGPEVLDHLPARADIVISHTAPAAFRVPGLRDAAALQEMGWDPSPDPSRDVLDQVLATLRPSQWFFGHFHCYAKGEMAGCRWTGLARLDAPNLADGSGWMRLQNL